MGDIADMMLDGILCEQCGVYLHSDGPGYPVRCGSCKKGERTESIRQANGYECGMKSCRRGFATKGDRKRHMAAFHRVRFNSSGGVEEILIPPTVTPTKEKQNDI